MSCGADDPFRGTLFIRLNRRENGILTLDGVAFGPVVWAAVAARDGELCVSFSTGQHRSSITRCLGPYLATFADGLWRVNKGFPCEGETFTDVMIGVGAPYGWPTHALEPVVEAMDKAWAGRRDDGLDEWINRGSTGGA